MPEELGAAEGLHGQLLQVHQVSHAQKLPVVTSNYVCFLMCRSPIRKWDEARQICMAYRHQDSDHADLASVSEIEEYRFIVDHLNKIDPQHRRW